MNRFANLFQLSTARETEIEILEEDDDIDLEDEEFPLQRTRMDSIRLIQEMYDKGSLDIDPSYQRDSVWPRRYQQDLIHTLWKKRSYIPPVVIHDMKPGRHRVIDGKQRLLAVIGFIKNEFKDKSGRYFDHPDKESFSEDDRNEFLSLTLTQVYYRNLTLDQELSIFHDLQKAIPLKQGERYRASPNKIITSVTDYSDKYRLFKYGPKIVRDQDLANCVRMVLAVMEGAFTFQHDAVTHKMEGYLDNVLWQNPHKNLEALFETLRPMVELYHETDDDLLPCEIMVLGSIVHAFNTKKSVDIKNLTPIVKIIHDSYKKATLTKTINHPNTNWLLEAWLEHFYKNQWTPLPKILEQTREKLKRKRVKCR